MAKLHYSTYICCLFSLLMIAGCSGNRKKNPEKEIKIERLDTAVNAGYAPDSLNPGKDMLLAVTSSIYGRNISQEELSASGATKMFQKAVDQRLGSLDSVQTELSVAFSNAHKLIPGLKEKKLYGVILPVSQSVITSDSIILIGLNHYLGSDFEGYNGFPEYIRQKKNKQQLPVDVAEATISSEFPYLKNESPTVLNRMLYEGALLYVMSEIFPEKTTAQLMAISPEQQQWLEHNLKNIYMAILQQDMLFSSDPATEAKLMNPSAGTFIIHQDAPPMAGRFLGLQIVRQYIRNNPGITSRELLSSQFYNNPSTLKKARFNP